MLNTYLSDAGDHTKDLFPTRLKERACNGLSKLLQQQLQENTVSNPGKRLYSQRPQTVSRQRQ
jgi:hypothetical protein